jgi:hypothetical protein
MDWLKKRWQLVVAGIVAIAAFMLGRKGKKASDSTLEQVRELKDEEIKIEKELSAQEKLEIAKAYQKYVAARNSIRRQQRAAKTKMEIDKANRKLELLELAKESPEEIDNLLATDYGILKI